MCMLRINDKNSGAKDSFDFELFNLGSVLKFVHQVCLIGSQVAVGCILKHFGIIVQNAMDVIYFLYQQTKTKLAIMNGQRLIGFASYINL